MFFVVSHLKGTLFGNMFFWWGQIFGITSVLYSYTYDYVSFLYQLITSSPASSPAHQLTSSQPAHQLTSSSPAHHQLTSLPAYQQQRKKGGGRKEAIKVNIIIVIVRKQQKASMLDHAHARQTS
jgi:hypothetical protein